MRAVLFALVFVSGCASQSLNHPAAVKDARSRIYASATLVAHATSIASQACVEYSDELFRRGRIDESHEWRHRCDDNATAVWANIDKVYYLLETGGGEEVSACQVAAAAKSLKAMNVPTSTVADALREAEWSEQWCR